MKDLNVYSEHIKNSMVGSIKDNISRVPDVNKDKVLDYLKQGTIIAGCPGILRDVFTGERIPGCWSVYTDGVYEWESDIIYYYETYNLRLPSDFMEYVCEIIK